MSAGSRPSGEDLLAIAEAGVKRARARGIEEVEVYASFESATRVEFRGRLGDVQETGQAGVCVRLVRDKRQGSAGVPGLSDRSVDQAIERALLNAAHSPPDPKFVHYADPVPTSAAPTRVDDRIATPDADRVLRDAKSAADGVAAEKDVTYVTFQLSSVSETFGVANARGVAAWDRDAREGFLAELRVTRGSVHKTSNEFGYERKPLSDRYDLRELLAAAVARGRSAFEAAPLEGRVDAVIVDPVPAMLLLSPVIDALSLARTKKDGLAEKIGERIASPGVTLRDDPHRGEGVRCQRVDDEGTPTRPMTLVQDGILEELPTHAYLAHQSGERSTGNGYRTYEGRWTGTPRPRIASVDMAAGAKPLQDVLAGVDRAVYVRDYLLGWFTNNQVTGDFSTVAPLAFLVEKGSVVHALPPTTLAGNAYRMIEQVEGVSRERRTLLRGSFPALRVGGLTCAT